MKFRSGNTHQNKNWREFQRQVQICSNMEKKSKGAIAQKKYRDKARMLNKMNAAFMEFAKEKAPWLVEQFLNKNTVV